MKRYVGGVLADDVKGSRIIGRVLPAAVRLWLRSQVEQVEDLSLDLGGRDREIISGYLPSVSIAATQAIYQGIHIGRLQLSAQDIRINIGQVLRGKQLRLMKAFPVLGEVSLSADDLNASLTSPLLSQGLNDFWRSLIQNSELAQLIETRYGQIPLQPDVILRSPKIRLGNQCLGLSFYPRAQGQTAEQKVILGTGLSIFAGNQLQLNTPRWLEHLDDLSDPSEGQSIDALQGFQWNLGSDTQLSQLALQTGQLVCNGQIMVNP